MVADVCWLSSKRAAGGELSCFVETPAATCMYERFYEILCCLFIVEVLKIERVFGIHQSVIGVLIRCWLCVITVLG